MRIADWNPAACPQPQELVQAVLARRGGALLQLDKALLWSAPLAAGWNTYLGNVRTKFGADRRLAELGICTVARLTGAEYEYAHHAPEFLRAGGTQQQLDALQAFLAGAASHGLQGDELLVAQYARAMTREVQVDDALFARMKERFGNTDLVELTATIAAYNMVARFLVALGITPEDER